MVHNSTLPNNAFVCVVSSYNWPNNKLCTYVNNLLIWQHEVGPHDFELVVHREGCPMSWGRQIGQNSSLHECANHLS